MKELVNKIKCSSEIHCNYSVQQTGECECHFVLFFCFGKYFSTFWFPYCTLSCETLTDHLWNVPVFSVFILDCLSGKEMVVPLTRMVFFFWASQLEAADSTSLRQCFSCAHCCYIETGVHTFNLPVQLADTGSLLNEEITDDSF